MFYINEIGKGGAERVVTNLCNYFSEYNEVVLLTTRFYEPEYSISSKVRQLYLPSNKLNDKFSKISFSKFYHLKKIIKEEKPDIVLSFLPEASFRVAAVKKYTKVMKNIPLIVSIRDNPYVEYRNKVIFKIMKTLYKNIDGMIVQTEDCLNYFNFLNCDKKVIPNPINQEFVDCNFNGERKKTIVSVNRLTEQKNPFLLIHAFEKFIEKEKNYNLVMYGDGNLKEQLNNYIKENKLENKIFLPGKVNNVKDYIIDASMFVLSSNHEGMPNALMEAMALGLPCIATDSPIGGCRFLIQNNENGILIPVDGEQELVKAMEKIAKNPKFSEKLSENAKKISDTLDPSKIYQVWNDYIFYIIERSKQR